MAGFAGVWKWTDGPLPNLFVLPYEESLQAGAQVPGAVRDDDDASERLVLHLRDLVFSAPRSAGSLRSQVSEKDWLRGAVKAWDAIRRSQFIKDYFLLRKKAISSSSPHET